MRDLKNSGLIWIKGILFFLIAVVSATLLLLEMPTLKSGVLLALCIWAFCRAYYFAFYVIEKYVDPEFRFAGLTSFLRYVIQKRHR